MEISDTWPVHVLRALNCFRIRLVQLVTFNLVRGSAGNGAVIAGADIRLEFSRCSGGTPIECELRLRRPELRSTYALRLH